MSADPLARESCGVCAFNPPEPRRFASARQLFRLDTCIGSAQNSVGPLAVVRHEQPTENCDLLTPARASILFNQLRSTMRPLRGDLGRSRVRRPRRKHGVGIYGTATGLLVCHILAKTISWSRRWPSQARKPARPRRDASGPARPGRRGPAAARPRRARPSDRSGAAPISHGSRPASSRTASSGSA